MADAVFKVEGHSKSPAKLEVQARNFNLVVDEPPELGGTDHGANPVEYILTGLVGCLNVVGHLVAGELGFQINDLKIDAEGPLNPARLFGQDTEDRAGYKNIHVNIQADTDADESTVKKWLEIVESRCPVSDNLGNSTPIVLSLNE